MRWEISLRCPDCEWARGRAVRPDRGRALRRRPERRHRPADRGARPDHPGEHDRGRGAVPHGARERRHPPVRLLGSLPAGRIPAMLSLDDVRAAAARLDGVAHRTPVLRSRTLDGLAGAGVHLKAECFQRGGAFKFRGAYSLISTARRRASGPRAWSRSPRATTPRRSRWPRRCSASAATIVMPQDAPALKLAATRGYGAEVVALRPLRGRPRGDRARPGRRARRRAGAAVRPPAGDGRPGHGRARAAGARPGRWTRLLAPVGGGGLVAGCATVAAAARPGDPGDRRRARGGRRHAPLARPRATGSRSPCRGRSPTASRSRRPAS